MAQVFFSTYIYSISSRRQLSQIPLFGVLYYLVLLHLYFIYVLMHGYNGEYLISRIEGCKDIFLGGLSKPSDLTGDIPIGTTPLSPEVLVYEQDFILSLSRKLYLTALPDQSHPHLDSIHCSSEALQSVCTRE